MQITINTAEPLSGIDVAILGLLTGTEAKSSSVAVTATPAKKAAAAPAKAATPDPEPEPEADDVVGGDDVVDLATARKLAMKMVSDGKTADVKAALKEVGAGKVSELTPEQVGPFYELINV